MVELSTLMALPRPRDRMSTVVETWGWDGRHGVGEKGEERRPETAVEERVDVDGLDASAESLDPVVESLDGWVVDQGVEDRRLEDHHRRPRRRRPA